jgi:hypothetical protein
MTESAVLEELRELEVRLHQPAIRRSRDVLDRLLHPDFVEVGRSGRRFTRAEMIELLLAESGTEPVESQGYQVVVLSSNAALLTYRSGGLRRPTFRASVWLREAEGWQMVYHQGTPVSEPASS